MSTTPAKMTGICHLNVNGARMRAEKGASLEVGGPVGESAMSTSGFEGTVTKEIKPAKISATLLHSDKDDVSAIQRWRGVTVTFETDSNQTYLIQNAGTVGDVKFKDGKIDFELEGAPAELL
ncbi:hypothetical protein DTO96_102524 [Ephemeroptericola cinctiostellae]|uniref:Phage tail tube protein n=1 Tax=Ephemeroptericola cinctiostellae TaxID=2268024 RepID=A0A345DEI0_9BURK|nr:phage tail tube protein [Ephemeroptericola cinctiostellae]AXF86768.1 hypothetical protein DTO96_102524 [Ephemeroptericola cinctiostellae]